MIATFCRRRRLCSRTLRNPIQHTALVCLDKGPEDGSPAPESYWAAWHRSRTGPPPRSPARRGQVRTGYPVVSSEQTALDRTPSPGQRRARLAEGPLWGGATAPASECRIERRWRSRRPLELLVLLLAGVRFPGGRQRAGRGLATPWDPSASLPRLTHPTAAAAFRTVTAAWARRCVGRGCRCSLRPSGHGAPGGRAIGIGRRSRDASWEGAEVRCGLSPSE